MKIEIDQLGHVEYTSHRTVVADSQGNALYITTATKKRIQELYRQAKKPRLFVYETFALLTALLIKISYSKTHQYIIDTEYPGKSDLIKRLILKFSKQIRIPLRTEQINFGAVKEGSKSDKMAHSEFTKIQVASKISIEQLLKLLFPQKKDRVVMSV